MGLFDFFKNNKQTNNNKQAIEVNNINVKTTVSTNTEHELTLEEKKAMFLYSINYPMQVMENEDYARKYLYDFNITDCKKMHQELIKDGYLELANFDEVVDRYRVDEIKQLLSKYNIPFEKEKKDQLIELAKQKLTEQQKADISNELLYYVHSNKVSEYLSQFEDLIYIYNHKNWAIPYWMFKEQKQKMESYFKRGDVIWAIFQERLLKPTNSYSNLCGIYMNMAEFLEEENKQVDALRYYISVFYLYINQCWTQECLKHYSKDGLMTKKEILETIDEKPIPDKLFDKINELGENTDDRIFEKLYSTIHLKYNLIEENEFKDIINKIYTDKSYKCEKEIKSINLKLKDIVNKF